ncbi:Pericentrin, partial [Dissostichus eleginoides]
MDDDERQRKLEAGRAKKASNMSRSQSLASYRQQRAKGNSAGTSKKTQKRKGQTVSQNDGATQGRPVDAALSSANDTELNKKTNHEEPQKPEKSNVQKNQQRKDQPPALEQSPSPVEDIKEEELIALTGKEQLKQLQEAVEKRNEIIARLSSNLQEALASRDQVQLEAQSLAGQIQGLQRQLQQTSVEFLRIKSQSGAEVLNTRQQHGRCSQGADLNHKEAPSGSAAPETISCVEGFSTETDTALEKLRVELEEERMNSQRIYAELALEMEKHQHVLSLLEKEKNSREEEQKEKEEQLQDLQMQFSLVQTQCLEMQQYKEEKEKLNREVLELRKRLKEEPDAERRLGEEVASSALRLQRQEEEMLRLKEEHREEVEGVRQLLEEREKELKFREEEVLGLKASKNRQNKAKAGFSFDEKVNIDEADLETGPVENSMNVSVDILMERYMSSDRPAHSQSSVASDSLERCGQLDISADYSFELNSEVLGDEPLLSISNRFLEEDDNLFSGIPLPDNSNPQSPSQWLYNSTPDELETSKLSEQQFEQTDLEKELLNQQCDELRDELLHKDRDLNVLREEVINTAEELEEARSRWGQVTEELRQALWELEEEKEKKRLVEDEMNLKAHEQDNLKNKLSALMEEREKENAVLLTGKEAAETSLLVPAITPSEEEDQLVGELKNKQAALPSHQKQRDLLLLSQQEIKQPAISAEQILELRDDKQLQTLQAQCEHLLLQLEEMTTTHKTTAALIGQKTTELDRTLKELETTRAQVVNVQTEVDRLQGELEKSLGSLDTAENIKKMEQVLEEELEQFESLLKAKDVELSEKQLLAVEEETERLKTSHQQEIKDLMERHQQEISELNTHLESEQLKQQVSMEEEQKRQISFIKQVTEREHERMLSELSAKHNEELTQLRTEVSLELRESMEAAHQAELQQDQVQKRSELEAMRLSLTNAHVSQLEQEQQNKEQQEKLRELQQQPMNDLQQQWETLVAQERAAMEEEQAKDIQALRSQWDKNAESRESNLQMSLSEMQNGLTATQTDLTQTLKALSQTQAELSQTQAELQRDAAARSLEELMSSHKAVLQEREQQALHLEEKEEQLKQEVLRLQEERTSLKKNSEQEVGQLWTQLESMRTSRQELGELKEQLLARSARVDDIERLKTEFNEQKREIKEQNEAELESLRRYFEQRLRATEEGHREEIALLQLRLVERALEESVIRTADDSSISQGQAEEEKDHLFSDAVFKLEKHKEALDSVSLQLEEKHTMDLSYLQSSMSLSFKEELQQVQSDITDQYYEELQELKTRHAMELEQLRAKLSEHHVQELTRAHLEAARQVEVEVEQRMWCLTEELQSRMTIVHTLDSNLAALSKQHDAEMQRNTQKLKQEFAELDREMESERTRLEQELHEEKERLKTLQAALDNDESPQVLIVRQRLEAQYDGELQRAKSCMATEVKERLHQAQERFQGEIAALEQSLAQKYEVSLAELKNKHQTELEHERAALLNKERDTLDAKHKAQLDSLSASHRDQLTATAVELESKHSAELVALEAALDSKRKADIESLEGVLKETNQAQLEASEAQLTRKHQEEKDELEMRMLGNMDTLESTYLKEVQALRDEIIQLEERHCRGLNLQKSEHRQVMERHASEQLSIREELRKELAQLHIEKFSAMAAELSHVHKTELTAQKEALDTEHCKALETLKKQVLEVEQQHSLALQELSQTCTADKEQLLAQQHLQLQELRGVSARELEACRRELEEESSRQRQHFLEEVELLKVQSEERLQDRINRLKTEFEEQKEARLEDLKRSFTSEQEEKERSYTDKMSQLTIQLQQLDTVVAQLRAEVGCLQGELEGKRSEMETLDTLLQRRQRETQEGGNLLKMLTDDLQAGKEERRKLNQANAKLKNVLIEMIRSTIATEDMIGQKINARAKTSEHGSHQRSSTGNEDAQESGISVADMSSQDMELTHLLCESLLVSDTQINPGGEEAALNACSRLRHTVDTLLDLLNHANKQLEQLMVSTTLWRRSSLKHKILLEQLDQEAKLKSELQLEYHKAEGLLEGYVAEKALLEESLQQKEVQEERLVEELEDLKVKLHQMQGLTAELDGLRQKHQELSEEHSLLLRQKEHLSAGLGEREKALLAETERLTQDRLDLQRQAEKDHKSLSLRLRALERDLEEKETQDLETEQHHKTNTEDLNQRVQALEKQLKHDRQFIEEQAVEREHERDEFQQEIRSLEAQLRQTASVDNKGHRFQDLVLQVESLQAIIKDKTEDHDSLIAANQQAQRDLAERNEEIDKLAGRIRELEQALLNNAEGKRSISQLEQELHRSKLREQELSQDKQALEQQQLSNRLQISALQSKVDETRHCYHDNQHEPTQELSDALDLAQQSLRSKEQEVEAMVGQLETLQSELGLKEVELKHLALQLEQLTNQNADHVNELQEQIDALKENVSALAILNEEREEQSEAKEPEEENFPSALLEEKNQEIDHLNAEIQRLEQELDNTGDNKALEAELEDLCSQVEHLQSEVMRVRQDKQEEVERLHEVISTLQAELATLGPNLHEVSDSQDGDSINPSPAPSPEPDNYTIREETLQSQLETAAAEKEGLERLLLTQEEEYRGHGEEFGKRLTAEREKADKLQSVLTLKEAELDEVKAQKEGEAEERKLSEEVNDKVQNQEMSTLHDKNLHLNSLIAELQKKEQERVTEIDTLKTKEQEMKMETEVLRETSLTLERQVQEMRAELVDMEELVDEERIKIKTLKTVKGELSAERETLRRREGKLQEEIEKLRQEATSMRACIQELTVQLNERESSQEEAQKEVLTHAEVTLAKADAALRQREAELAGLRAEHQALRAELTAVKRGLSTSTERAEKLHEEGQTKDRALLNLETDNQRLKAQLRALQEDLAVQEEELAYQQRELQQLRQHCDQQDTLPHQRGHTQKDISHRVFEDVVSVSRDEVSLSSPEVLRRLECSEDRIPERFRASAIGSRLSEFSALNSTGLDLHHVKTSPRVVMESPRSRTITPEPATQSSRSPISGSVSVSDNFSMLDSLDTDKVRELEDLDMTTPSSPLGSTSSLSAPEWASDGYGSNVSSELGARLKLELEQTERLDAQFLEYLRCRGMNPTVNTDSAAGSMSYSDELLSPELQCLLKKVYQESCRILTLSKRRATSSTYPHVSDLRAEHHSEGVSIVLDRRDNPSSIAPMGWQQEKRALQETVVALRELLCRMAQRPTQTDHRIEGDWHGDRVDGQVESQLRAELEESQKQLKCAHDTQQEQKNKIQSVRVAVAEGEEALRREQALHVSSEQQRSEVMALKGLVEQERVACSNLRRELQIEQSRNKTRLERLLTEAESRLAEIHSKLAEAHRKVDEERERYSRQVDELSRRHEADATRDRKFSDMQRTNDKLCELEMLRQQDQQRMQELQHTLVELEREEKEMAAQRLRQHNMAASSQHLQSDFQTGSAQHNQQMPSSQNLLERMMKENSELTKHVTSLSQEKATLKHRLTFLERELRLTENELAMVTTETENRPINDVISNAKVQRLYERYLRAESFRKALVYQKRYLILLLGGFQECEQATLCLIARMGAWPTPPLSSCNRPRSRFRAVVRVVIAVSRMKFLTRKWQKAIKRLSISGSVNGHAPGPKAEVLRQQQPRIHFESPPNRDSSSVHRDTVSALVPPKKSPFRLHNRSYSSPTPALETSGGTSQDPERSLTEYIHHLEKVQQRLVGARQVSKTHIALSPKEERRIQPPCSPDMIGNRQRWLRDNRTWLYLSCLSPPYVNGP